MNAELKDGHLVLSLSAVLDSLTDEEKRDLADRLSCEDALIEDVSAQLLDGWTERASHGAKGVEAAEAYTPLDRARRELARRAGDVAADVIDALERVAKRERARGEAYRAWGWRLYQVARQHALPCIDSPPSIDEMGGGADDLVVVRKADPAVLDPLIASAAKLRELHAVRCTPAKHANPKQRHVECLALDLADELTRILEERGVAAPTRPEVTTA